MKSTNKWIKMKSIKKASTLKNGETLFLNLIIHYFPSSFLRLGEIATINYTEVNWWIWWKGSSDGLINESSPCWPVQHDCLRRDLRDHLHPRQRLGWTSSWAESSRIHKKSMPDTNGREDIHTEMLNTKKGEHSKDLYINALKIKHAFLIELKIIVNWKLSWRDNRAFSYTYIFS